MQSGSENRGKKAQPDRDRFVARLKTQFLADGTYLFEDRLDTKSTVTAKVITCRAWLLELYEIEAGELFFLRGGMNVSPATKCAGFFCPPFTISQLCLSKLKGRVIGMAAIRSFPGIPRVPTLFELTRISLPAGPERVAQILKTGRNFQSIEINPKASALSVRTKALIDTARSIDPSIARIARHLRVTPEHLSRQFRRDYGISPRAYLHQLRLADVPLQLAKGESIADVSNEMGYGDLSRFYKQFRKRTTTSPGLCRRMIAPRA